MEQQSKYILTDGTVGYFEIGNTPIANFCTSGGGTSTVVINTKSVVKSLIKSIVFGETYRVTTSIPTNFLYNFIGLEYVDLAPFTNVTSINLNFCVGTILKDIDLSPLEKLSAIGSGFLSNNIYLKKLDISALTAISTIGNNFCSGCTKIIDINIGKVNYANKVIGTNSLSGVVNSNNCIIRAETLELAETFIKKITAINNWSVAPTLAPKRNWILKIFKSFNFMGNKIYNARVDDPKLGEHIVNKRTLVRETTYDTVSSRRFRNPFKFPWMQVSVSGLRFKKLFDEILFPRIPYQYSNPVLDLIDFDSNITNNAYNIIHDLGDGSSKPGLVPMFQQFYDTNNFGFKLNFNIKNPDRPSAGQARLKIYASNGTTFIGTFSATNNNDFGTINVSNFIFKDGYKIIFEKQYTASPIKNDTHGEPSPQNGFTDIGYLYQEDITDKFYCRFMMLHSPILRLKTGTDAIAGDVNNGTNPPAGFTYNYSYLVSAGSECLFDILIPTGNGNPNPSNYNMEINIRLNRETNTPNAKVIHTIQLGDILTQLHCSTVLYTINGIQYRLGYINLGVFEDHPVKIDFILKPY